MKYRSQGIEAQGAQRAIIFSEGATFTLPIGIRSHYDGLIHQSIDRARGPFAIKILDSVTFEEAGAIEQITQESDALIVEYESGLIAVFALETTSRSTTLQIQTSEPASGTLRFDIRHVYDSEPFHKRYALEALDVKGSIAYTLSFEKQSASADTRYDVSQAVRFGFYGGSVSSERIERWTRIEDGYDAMRAHGDAHHFVYEPLRFVNCETIILTTKTRITKIDDPVSVPNVSSREQLAISAAREQLDGSILTKGSARYIMAGFPWFFHEWSRDAAISIGGMRSTLEANHRINILMRLAQSLSDSEMSIQYDDSSLRSADAMGLVMWRLSEEELSATNRKRVEKILVAYLHGIEHRLSDGLLQSGERETWMDTGAGFRAGACIEIQALYARMLDYAYELTGESYYQERLSKFIATLRDRFIGEDGRIIDHIAADGPFPYVMNNAFLACIIYPKLFEHGTWTWSFDHFLSVLTRPENPGMIFSLEERSPLFCARHEGESDRSYHRGDSWYFMNHIAALALSRIDRPRYAERIERIIEASIHDCLELGAFCAFSEVSSAHVQDSNGCWAQTWSAATFLELMESLGRA